MFFIYFFGLLVETELGIKRFVLLYLLSAILVNLTSLLFMPVGTLSVGASGVVFAFFSISIMMKMTWDWKAWVEILVLVPFVLSYLFTEINSIGNNDNIGHFAHLSGFVYGAILYKSIRKLKR
jgi:membrane associated rhomboid family serine protease